MALVATVAGEDDVPIGFDEVERIEWRKSVVFDVTRRRNDCSNVAMHVDQIRRIGDDPFNVALLSIGHEQEFDERKLRRPKLRSMLAIDRFCTVTQPIFVLDQRDEKVCLGVHLPTSLVQCILAGLFTEFHAGRISVCKFVSQRRERILRNGN